MIFMKRNVFLSFFLALSLSLSAPAFAADATPWYAEAQAYVTENALMTGTGHGFEPDATVTTATVLQTPYNLEGQPAVSHDQTPDSPWYAKALLWARSAGLSEELGEDSVIRRGGVKTILDAYCGLKQVSPAALMTGDENGDMMLDKTLTRAEFAQILMNLGELLSTAERPAKEFSAADATAYVEGLLKETYLGEFDKNYMTLVGITEEEAQATYENCLDVEAQFFCYFYDIEYPTEEQMSQIKDLYAHIYANAKFQVVSAAQQEDGSFSVKLSIEPINIVQLAEARFEDTMQPFYDKYPADVQQAMSDAEYEAMDQEYAQMILDLYESVMPEIGNEEAQSLVVQIEMDAEGYYSLNDPDFGRIDELIINYIATSDNT